MTTEISAVLLKEQLAEYLARAASGEHILVEEVGERKVALVSIADLRRLEASAWQPSARAHAAPPVADADDLARREAAFRRALEEAGLVIHWPKEPRRGFTEWEPLPPMDPPLSEQIIADRR